MAERKQLEQAGTFRGPITEYCLVSAESGAKAIRVTVDIEDIYYDGEWCDWREHEFYVHGDLWIVKKNGTINESQARSLVEYANWNGDLLQVHNQVWHPNKVAVVVNEDKYGDDVRYRISWINDYDKRPGGGNVSDADAKAMQSQYGQQFRALAGNVSRNAEKPASEVPSKPKAKTPSPKAPEDEGLVASENDIPF